MSEQDDYTVLNNYLTTLSNSLPITIELDHSFADNMEASKEVITNLFQKNVVRLDIVMEMQEKEFIHHLYKHIQDSNTIKEVTVIVNQDCSDVLNMIPQCPQVEQWIMDIRRPWEEQQEELKELIKNDQNNKMVLREVFEPCIDYRFPTSFEIMPII